uniref:PhoD-like phosphatase domain-containing protein n=1 Tax=Percolomonas cosmopolitus TaxID=63605 RepID=A0A7S1KRG8_9EUKA
MPPSTLFLSPSTTNSSFIPKSLSTFRIIRQLGPTHHTQKSIQVQCEPKIPFLTQKAKELLFTENEISSHGGIDSLSVVLMYNGDFGGFERLETQQQLLTLMRKYKKTIPTIKVELARDVDQSEDYDTTTENLFRTLLEEISKDETDVDAEQAQRILKNQEEASRVYNLYLQSCRRNIPDKLERHTYGIWYKSIEQYVRSILIHKRIQAKSGNDRAVFGSSFTLKQVTDELPSTLASNVNTVQDNQILAGPVMGFLSQDGTLRFSAVISESEQRDRQMFCSLVPANQKTSDVKTFPIKLREAPGVPHTMEVKQLLTDTPYVAIWTGMFNGDDKTAQFDTYPSSLANLKVVAISNSMVSDKNRALWKELDHEHPRFTLHLGGLINGDEAWKQAHKVLESYKNVDSFSNEVVTIEDRNAIREAYRRVYRAQWSEKNVQKSLSKRPNIFGFSDTDICSGFGSSPQDAQKGSQNFYIAEQARYVYWEYQRDLNDSVFSQYFEDTFATHEAHHFQIHDIAVVMLDTVTARTFQTGIGKEDGQSVLGSDQWNFLDNLFTRVLTQNGTKVLLLSASESFISGTDSEVTQLLSLAHQWKKSDPSRQVVIASSSSRGGAEYTLTSETQGDFASWIITSARGGNSSFAQSIDFGNGLYRAQKVSQGTGDKANFAIISRQHAQMTTRLFA